jgi:hypothetical protein
MNAPLAPDMGRILHHTGRFSLAKRTTQARQPHYSSNLLLFWVGHLSLSDQDHARLHHRVIPCNVIAEMTQ